MEEPPAPAGGVLDDVRTVKSSRVASAELPPTQAPLAHVLGLTGAHWSELCALRVRDLVGLPHLALRTS